MAGLARNGSWCRVDVFSSLVRYQYGCLGPDRSNFTDILELMHAFYMPDLGLGVTELPEEEARHATSVLRLRVGDRISLLDGKGARAEAIIEEISKRGCSVRVVDRTELSTERNARIHLAAAPTKQMERFEWMLEKCTEIGVDRITPLITDRSEREKLRRDRLERVIVSAMKQSQRVWLPKLDEPTSLNDLISGAIPDQRLFGWCEGERKSLTSTYRPQENALLLIGPEGDFTPEEAKTLIDRAFTPVSMGIARLRTETAAITACAWMNLAQG